MYCRLCLSENESENAIDIFASETDTNWQEIIGNHLGLKIERNNTCSTMICQNCTQNLEQFHIFYKQVHERQHLLFDTQIKSQTEEKIEEPIKVKTEDGSYFEVSEFLPEDYNAKSFQVVNEAFSESNQFDSSNGSDIGAMSNNRQGIYSDITITEYNTSVNEIATCRFNDQMKVTNATKEDKDLTCPHCQKIFKRRESMNSHLKIKHNVINSLICQICKANFSGKGTLQRHLDRFKGTCQTKAKEKVVVSEEYRTCFICHQVMKSTHSLKRHVMLNH